MYCQEDVYLSSWKDQTFHLRSTQDSMCGKPLLIKAPPEDMKTVLLREQYIMFSSRIPEEEGEGRLPARQGPPGTGAGPWLLLISYPKHTFSWKVTRVAARTTPQAGQCSLAWAQLIQKQQKHPSAKITSVSLPLTCTMFKAFSGRDAFISHRNLRAKWSRNTQKLNQDSSLPLLQLWSVAIWRHDIKDRPAHPEQSPSTSSDPLQAACFTAILHQPMSQMHLNILYFCMVTEEFRLLHQQAQTLCTSYNHKIIKIWKDLKQDTIYFPTWASLQRNKIVTLVSHLFGSAVPDVTRNQNK